VHVNFDGYVAGGCRRENRQPAERCQSSDVGQRVAGGNPEFTGGSEVGLLHFKIWNESGQDCRLHFTATLSVRHDGMPVRSLIGSPASLKVRVLLKPRDEFNAGWLWDNWCGAHVRAHFDLLGRTLSEPRPSGARCGSGKYPSTLGAYFFNLIERQ
jgi:hypothetical protein